MEQTKTALEVIRENKLNMRKLLNAVQVLLAFHAHPKPHVGIIIWPPVGRQAFQDALRALCQYLEHQAGALLDNIPNFVAVTVDRRVENIGQAARKYFQGPSINAS